MHFKKILLIKWKNCLLDAGALSAHKSGKIHASIHRALVRILGLKLSGQYDAPSVRSPCICYCRLLVQAVAIFFGVCLLALLTSSFVL